MVRVEIRHRDGSTFAGRSGYLRFRGEDAARRLAHRLADVLRVPLRTGATDELEGAIAVEETLAE